MKIISLDIGDIHTGTAISDISHIIAIPYQTVSTNSLESFLKDIIEKENISTIVLGYPKTMQGNISKQTQKVIELKKEYEKKFSNIKWVLWDERLTSKKSEKLKKIKNKEDKIRSHSIAAAFILDEYLEYLKIHKYTPS